MGGAALGALLGLAMLGTAGSLSGCGLKGALYLPPQKKAKVPATSSNPSPEPAPTPTGEAAPSPEASPVHASPPGPGSPKPAGGS